MGACYAVLLTIKVKNEHKAINALKKKIARGKEEHINYNIEQWEKESGKKANTLENLIRIFLCDRNNDAFTIFQPAKDKSFTCFDNIFDCCYGWEEVMIDMFYELAPFLEDDSSLYIEPDNDYDMFIITNGKVIQTH